MIRTILFAAVLVVAGCAGSTPIPGEKPVTLTPLQALIGACDGYATTLTIVATMDAMGKLTDEQNDAVELARSLINPVCNGPMPAEGDAARIALASIQAELNRLIIIRATQE
jgi:hypothetical protein